MAHSHQLLISAVTHTHTPPEDRTGGFTLAADEKQGSLEEGDAERGAMVRVEVEQELPMSVELPIEVQVDPARQPFPFLDTTLADLGIQE